MERNLNQRKEEKARGKTKIIYGTEDPDVVFVENNDVLSKGDGKVKYTLPGKGILATTTTCNVFELLKMHGVPVAYIGRIDERTFSAYLADMVGLEIVVRNIAFGSYLKRNPGVQEGKIFKRLVIEIYFKNDEKGDPIAVYDLISGRWLLFNAKKPMTEVIQEIPYFVTKKGIPVDAGIIRQIIEMAHQINTVLKNKWADQDVALVDFKFEVGFIIKDGIVTLVLADVLDNDSWRIWPLGDKRQMMDKENFRILDEVSEKDRESLKEKYEWVAEASGLFLRKK